MAYNPKKHHSRSIRLKGYDYSQAGAYFITLCTKNMRHLFGEVIDEEMVLNEVGQIAYDEWLKTEELRPTVSLDVFQIMPNHMHGIIVVKQKENDRIYVTPPRPPSPGELHSPPIPQNDDYKAEFKSPSNNIGAIVRGYKSAVTKQANALGRKGTVWHRDYYENIIRTERDYWFISDYIINNPKKWAADKFYKK